MEKESFYFSGENLDLLYNILKDDIHKKFNYDINSRKNEYKTKLFNIMNNIYIHNKQKSIKTLNQKVLKTAAQEFINSVKKQTQKAQSSNIELRDMGIRDGSIDLVKKTSIDIRPKSSTNNLPQVSNEFENMKRERDKLENRPVNNPKRFQEKEEEKINLTDIENEFQKRNNELSENSLPKPSVDFKSELMSINEPSQEVVNNIVNNTNNNTNNNIDNNIVNNIDNNFVSNLVSNIDNIDNNIDNNKEKDITEKRNEIQFDSIINNQNADPNELYKRNMKDFSELDKHFKEKSSISDNPVDLLIPTTNIKYIEKQNIVTISSVDRDWTNNNNTRYNYSVFFNTSQDTTEIVTEQL
tara:strand:- start:596 stop:1660 length:1065 start_codon:yes stop_codon:yes gene_type:complete